MLPAGSCVLVGDSRLGSRGGCAVAELVSSSGPAVSATSLTFVPASVSAVTDLPVIAVGSAVRLGKKEQRLLFLRLLFPVTPVATECFHSFRCRGNPLLPHSFLLLPYKSNYYAERKDDVEDGSRKIPSHPSSAGELSERKK